MSHTQGRLATNGDTISDSGGEPIAYLEWSGHHEEDARRLVACWNACEDLPQDALDGGWTAAGISQYAKRLEGERDELLEALRDLHDQVLVEFSYCPDPVKFDAILAKYKETN